VGGIAIPDQDNYYWTSVLTDEMLAMGMLQLLPWIYSHSFAGHLALITRKQKEKKKKKKEEVCSRTTDEPDSLRGGQGVRGLIEGVWTMPLCTEDV
jgi:hypothetical protein